MREFVRVLTYAFVAISVVACEPKPRGVTMTFSEDTIINGVKTEKIIKTGRVRQLTRHERDSVIEIVRNAEMMMGLYLPRKDDEDTIAYLDKLTSYWKDDSLLDKTTNDQIINATAIQFGQALVDNNNFEWKFFGKELMIEEEKSFRTAFPYEISFRIIYKNDSVNFQGTKSKIIRDVKISRQLDEIGSK